MTIIFEAVHRSTKCGTLIYKQSGDQENVIFWVTYKFVYSVTTLVLFVQIKKLEKKKKILKLIYYFPRK